LIKTINFGQNRNFSQTSVIFNSNFELSKIEINSQKCSVYRNGAFLVQKWRQIRVGDIIEIGLNDVIPADCLIIGSSNPNGICFIETANLGKYF